MEKRHVEALIEIVSSYPTTKVIHVLADVIDNKADASEERIRRHVRKLTTKLRTDANAVRFL